MSDDDDTPVADTTPGPEAGKGWSEQDRRTLIITVVGGLAANVGTVILVGGAIALVRLGKASVGDRLVSVLIGLVFGLFMLVLGNSYRPRRPRSRKPGSVGFYWLTFLAVLFMGFGLLLTLEALLILVGIAAGVK